MFRIGSLLSVIIVLSSTVITLDAQVRRGGRASRSATVQTAGWFSGTVGILGASTPKPASPSVQMPAEQGPAQPTVGLTIVPTFDSTITSQPNAAQIQSTINNTIAVYQNMFVDPITVTILFRYASTEPCTGATLPTTEGGHSNFGATFQPWATFITALNNDKTSAADTAAINTLPATPLSTNIIPTTANARAVGINVPGSSFTGCPGVTGGPYDGVVTLNSAVAFSYSRPVAPATADAIRTLEHEIDEVLGIGSYLDIGTTDVRPEDIWTFSAPGTRNISASGTRYFSLDSGNTSTIGLNQGAGDHGDWVFLGCPSPQPHVQDAIMCEGESADIGRSTPEIVVLDVIGYSLTGPTAANVAISGRVLTSDGTGIRNVRVWITDVNGLTVSTVTNAFGSYSFAEVTSGRDYTIGATAKGYTFQPRVVSVQDSISDMDFMASP